jgi:hypothetical protein
VQSALNQGYNSPFSDMEYTILDNYLDVGRRFSIEQIEDMVKMCETYKEQRVASDCAQVTSQEFKEAFEEYKNVFKARHDSFVFKMSALTTGIIVILLYSYLKKDSQSKKLITLILASCIIYIVSIKFYELSYRIVFVYPTKPDSRNLLPNLGEGYEYSTVLSKVQITTIIRILEESAQNCQKQAKFLKESSEESYQRYQSYVKFYNDKERNRRYNFYAPSDSYEYREYQKYKKQYEYWDQCYQENDQVKKTYEQYQNSLNSYEKNLRTFSFVMAITTTGSVGTLLYRLLRKKAQDEQFSSTDENYQAQTSYGNYSSNQSQVLSFEEWLNQNPTLQYFSEPQQRQAYQNYLSSLGGNQ